MSVCKQTVDWLSSDTVVRFITLRFFNVSGNVSTYHSQRRRKHLLCGGFRVLLDRNVSKLQGPNQNETRETSLCCITDSKLDIYSDVYCLYPLKLYLSTVVRKPFFGVPDQVSHEPVCLRMFAKYNFEFSVSGFYLVEQQLRIFSYFSNYNRVILMIYSSKAINI